MKSVHGHAGKIIGGGFCGLDALPPAAWARTTVTA